LMTGPLLPRASVPLHPNPPWRLDEKNLQLRGSSRVRRIPGLTAGATGARKDCGWRT